MKTRYQATGELPLFKWIWITSQKSSWLSGRSLSSLEGSDRWVNCFGHVLNKKKYPHFRLYWGNIRLLHPDSHHIIDHGTLDDRISYSQRVKEADFGKWDTLEEELKELYSNVFPDKVGIMIMKYSEEEVKEKIVFLNIQYCYTLEREGMITQVNLSTLLPMLRKL